MSDSGDQSRCCCYLCLDSKQVCAMTRGGVYLPMPEHIEMFCKTSHFTDCHHYVRGNQLSSEAGRKDGCKDHGRRQFRRIPDMFSLVLSTCDETGRPCQLLDAHAHTIDVSPGGVRLQSSRQLTPDNLVAITFGPDFSSPSLTGIGQVRWSVATDSPELYLAGLSFLDAATKQAIGRHMGIPM